jgi:hypothetical protein
MYPFLSGRGKRCFVRFLSPQVEADLCPVLKALDFQGTKPVSTSPITAQAKHRFMQKKLLVTDVNGVKRIIQISKLKYLLFKINRVVFFEYRKEEGWTGYLPVFLCRCWKHGFFLAHPHGFLDRLDCVVCLEEFFSSWRKTSSTLSKFAREAQE